MPTKNDTKIKILPNCQWHFETKTSYLRPMKNSIVVFLFALVIALFSVSCEKEIEIDLPAYEEQIVVQGSIEPGMPPVVILTYSSGYFQPADFNSIANSYVTDAIVTVSNGQNTVTLTQVCSSSLTPEQLQLAETILGIPAAAISALNICLYTTFDPSMFGTAGTTYTLQVQKDNHSLQAVTKLNTSVPIDSLWFASPNPEVNDTLGFIYGFMSDPDTTGNCYRWCTKRISHYPQWVPDENLRGMQKDLSFTFPLPSVYDDEFFNGLQFGFAYYRGETPFSTKFDDTGIEDGYFKRGDTVVVRGASIDYNVFRYFKTYEDQMANQGSPFALPSNIESNVNGGLGVWAAYATYYDTLVCN